MSGGIPAHTPRINERRQKVQLSLFEAAEHPALEELRKLGHVVPIASSQDFFLDRCSQLFQLIERLKPGPLKQLLQQLGNIAE